MQSPDFVVKAIFGNVGLLCYFGLWPLRLHICTALRNATFNMQHELPTLIP